MAEVSTTVITTQTEAKAAVTSLLQALQPALVALQQTLDQTFVIPAIDIPAQFVSAEYATQVTAAASAVQPAVFTAFASQIFLPDEAVIDAVDVVGIGAAPEFTLVDPILRYPTPLSTDLPDAPRDAPEFNAPAIPEQTFVFPDLPVLANVVIPDVPVAAFPTFDEDAPNDNLLAPTNEFSYTEAEYQSILLDPLKQKLLNDLLNGGYGIEPTDEQPLWERAREREMLAGETAIQQASSTYAARGFAVPPGAMLALIEGAQQAALEKISSVGRDIALKRADMYVENRKFVMTLTKDVEDMSWKYWSFAQERVLNAAKYAAEFVMQYFNVQLDQYKTRMEGYRTKAQVFDTLVKAALANLEAYKVQMEGARLSMDIQKLHVEVYRAQLSGVESLANIYKTRMDASRILADIENLKFTAFRAEVDAYTALVNAKSAEAQLYKAQLDGELAKVEVFKASVQAYGARVDAFRTVAQAAEAEMSTKIKSAGLTLDVYRANIDRYKAMLMAAQTDIQAMGEKYTNDIRRYTATVEGFNRSADAQATVSKANADIAMATAKVYSSHILGQRDALTNHTKMRGEAALGEAKIITEAVKGFAGQISGIAATIENKT